MMPTQLGQQNDIKLQNITRQELKRIEKSMKRPQFLGLLNEYMVEISDPKNREEYDEYLRQMQRQGELPKHMRLVELTPHFCIRTSIVSEKNRKHNMKFFINFCSTQYLQQPACQPSMNEEGKTVFGWKVPNSMGKIRYDQDKNGNPCQVADVAFSHKAFDIVDAQNSMPFRKNQFKSMLIAIGLQCAEKQLGERKQTLSKDYDILKNLKCKGGKPALLPLRYIKGRAYNKGQGPQQNIIQRDTQGRQTKLQKQITDLKQKAAEQKKKNQKKDEQDQMEEQLQDKKKLIQDLDEGIQQPKYSSIYTYPVDYSQFLQDSSYNKAAKVPSHFTVEFKLPRVESMDEIGGDALNVNENRIVLKIGDKYFIDLPFETFKLKYKLMTENVKAKFDKKKKVLRLVFPIDQSIKYYQEEIKKQQLPQQQIEPSKQQGEVVQNQTWKNKVLQASQPAIDLKIIENQQVKQQEEIEEPKKKLIQQIDEDDYPEELKENQVINQNATQPASFEQALEQQKTHAFSLRKYYQNKDNKLKAQPIENIPTQVKPNQLSYVFQETNDKVVLVIKIPNYKKQDLKVIYDELENNNFFIEWNTNQQDQKDMTKISVLNFKINQNFAKEIKKVQVVLRINFVAVFLHKLTVNKFWQKQSIQTVPLQSYGNFKQQTDLIERINQERAQFNKKNQQELRAKQAEKAKQSVKTLQNKQNIPQPKDKIEQNQEVTKRVYQIDHEKDQKVKNIESTKLQGEYFNLNNLPPQFLHFEMKFIETMD